MESLAQHRWPISCWEPTNQTFMAAAWATCLASADRTARHQRTVLLPASLRRRPPSPTPGVSAIAGNILMQQALASGPWRVVAPPSLYPRCGRMLVV
eukprot:symbB.v1.2.017023.t1/scaffold1285.1/size129168/2